MDHHDYKFIENLIAKRIEVPLNRLCALIEKLSKQLEEPRVVYKSTDRESIMSIEGNFWKIFENGMKWSSDEGDMLVIAAQQDKPFAKLVDKFKGDYLNMPATVPVHVKWVENVKGSGWILNERECGWPVYVVKTSWRNEK